MREILFRGKRIDNGEWIEGIPVKTHIGTFIVFEENPHYCNQYGYMEICELAMVDPATVGQYTELTANGKKIFEGDILKFGDKIGYVNHGTGCFCVKYAKPNYLKRNNPAIDIVLHECPNEVEIIGNIHDNPELLKGGADND